MQYAATFVQRKENTLAVFKILSRIFVSLIFLYGTETAQADMFF